MPIQVGERLPAAKIMTMGADGPVEEALSARIDGKTVVIFALPGAYTGTCTTAHVPSFIRTIDAFKGKGVSDVICLSVNDPFVMGAWGESTGASAAGIVMAGDPSAEFTKAVGMDFTAPPVGLYDRSKRYAMVVKDGVVSVLHEEENPGVCDVSGGEALLEAI